MSKNLGILEKVDHREIWPNEAKDFTPWLADNIDLVGKTLGMDLDLEATEKAIGSFQADIVCKEIESTVLIENQLEMTNHDHLGKLLTYAAGLEAVTIIWIAKKIRDEHRAALDWINKVTNESVQFFGLELEIWSIDGSKPAPRLHIVSKPNDWSKSFRRVVTGDEKPLHVWRREYWKEFTRVLKDSSGPIPGTRTPQPFNAMNYAVGTTGFCVGSAFNSLKSHIRVYLAILQGGQSERYLHALQEDQETIETELNFDSPLIWTTTAKEAKITVVHEGMNPKEKDEWPKQHDWLVYHLNKMHKVFAPRVEELHPDYGPQKLFESNDREE